MYAFIYKADIYCAECAIDILSELKAKNTPEIDCMDSDHWPCGPYRDGGGEADTPQHCGGCGVFLKNSLTADGEAYVRGELEKYLRPGDQELSTYSIAMIVSKRATEADAPACLADWATYYDTIWDGLGADYWAVVGSREPEKED